MNAYTGATYLQEGNAGSACKADLHKDFNILSAEVFGCSNKDGDDYYDERDDCMRSSSKGNKPIKGEGVQKRLNAINTELTLPVGDCTRS